MAVKLKMFTCYRTFSKSNGQVKAYECRLAEGSDEIVGDEKEIDITGHVSIRLAALSFHSTLDAARVFCMTESIGPGGDKSIVVYYRSIE